MQKLFYCIIVFVLSLLYLAVHADNVYITLPKDSKKFGVQSFTPFMEQVESAKVVLPNVDNADYRVKIINVELSKVKIPTEEFDELLFLETEQEKNPKFNAADSVASAMNAMTNSTRVTVKNTSNRALGCALTALHTTSAKTALFSKKYNKYVTETPVSSMAIIKPNAAATLYLDTTGVNIASSETVIALMVNAMHVTSKKHIFIEGNDKGRRINEAILVTDATTDIWITNGKKKIPINSQQLLEFPNDFIKGATRQQSHQSPNYYNMIAYMRACERIYEDSSEKVDFPVEYFNPDYISHLDKKELDNVYNFIMKKFNQKYIPMPVGLSGLLECGKYNFIAGSLADILRVIISFLLFLVPGLEEIAIGNLALEIGTTIQSIVEDSMAIGKGVAALKAKGRG